MSALVAAARADIVGVASVVDADTIEIRGQRTRLHGIDAPESGQTCRDEIGEKWRCGQQAALALQDFSGRRTVTCDERDVDRYGRIVGRCRVSGLGYHKYSHDYVTAGLERPAAACGRALEPPREWRRGR